MADRTTENQTLPEIRQFPPAEPRVETGPIVFGEDWPGTFIRGNNAANYAMHLAIVLADPPGPMVPFSKAALRGLLADLDGSNLVKRRG